MLRRIREGLDLPAAERQKRASRRPAEGPDGARYVTNLDPMIARDRRPAGTTQSQQCDSRFPCSSGGVRGNRGRIRMRSIDENIDFLVEEIVRQTLGAAKTAYTDRNRRQCRAGGAARERERNRQIGAPGNAFGKLPRLHGAAEDEDSHVAR
jgi:hypothetical protein